jgi:hypothetical protein
MLLMLQREASLVQDMRIAAAEFRQALHLTSHLGALSRSQPANPQRFTEPLEALQAAREDFLLAHAALLPSSLTDNLPVRCSSRRAHALAHLVSRSRHLLCCRCRV